MGQENSPHAQELWSFCFLREGDCWGNSFNQLWILRYVPVSVDSRVWNLERSPKRKEMHIRRCLFVIACVPLRGYVDWIWYYRFTNVPHWSNKLSCLIVSLPPSPACSCAMLCFTASFALSIAFIHAYWCIPKFKQAFVCSLRVWKSLIISSCFALPKTHWVLYHALPCYTHIPSYHTSLPFCFPSQRPSELDTPGGRHDREFVWLKHWIPSGFGHWPNTLLEMCDMGCPFHQHCLVLCHDLVVDLRHFRPCVSMRQVP